VHLAGCEKVNYLSMYVMSAMKNEIQHFVRKEGDRPGQKLCPVACLGISIIYSAIDLVLEC
jgi:tartrate dehydratase alpha subunit/fumarate hydratase class I-like protein